MASRVQSAPSTDAERGFTLIELLVVISIIGLLISIVVPSMAQGRAASKMALCLSNQRQLGLAIQAYAMNNDGAIPRGPNAPLPHDPNIFWDSLGSNQVWIETLNQPNGLGSLLQNDLAQPGVLFCPRGQPGKPGQPAPQPGRVRPAHRHGSVHRAIQQAGPAQRGRARRAAAPAEPHRRSGLRGLRPHGHGRVRDAEGRLAGHLGKARGSNGRLTGG